MFFLTKWCETIFGNWKAVTMWRCGEAMCRSDAYLFSDNSFLKWSIRSDLLSNRYFRSRFLLIINLLLIFSLYYEHMLYMNNFDIQIMRNWGGALGLAGLEWLNKIGIYFWQAQRLKRVTPAQPKIQTTAAKSPLTWSTKIFPTKYSHFFKPA